MDLPLFFIFQSDRANKDSDKEVQDPLKAITKTAISQLEAELEEVKEKIRIQAEQLGFKTLEKLKEMSPEIADVLTPEMTHKPGIHYSLFPLIVMMAFLLIKEEAE
tara:strand:+ start:926 stop:1243 length:318 start_codon:yes stop_codon:yes gene_type:complete